MKKFPIFIAILLATNPCQAALSAYYQGLKEIKELISDPYLAEALSQNHPITEIKLLEQDHEYRVYSISTEEKTVLAKLTYIPSARLGSRCYQIDWLKE